MTQATDDRSPTPPFQMGGRGAARRARRPKAGRRVTRRVARGYAKTHQRIAYSGRDAKGAPITHRIDRAAQDLKHRLEAWAKTHPWIDSHARHGLEEGEELGSGFVRFMDAKERGARDTYLDLIRTGNEAWSDVRNGVKQAINKMEKFAWRAYVRLA